MPRFKCSTALAVAAARPLAVAATGTMACIDLQLQVSAQLLPDTCDVAYVSLASAANIATTPHVAPNQKHLPGSWSLLRGGWLARKGLG